MTITVRALRCGADTVVELRRPTLNKERSWAARELPGESRESPVRGENLTCDGFYCFLLWCSSP